MDAMEELYSSGMLSAVDMEGDVIDVRVAPPAEVGTFSEEERSKQVGMSHLFSVISLVHLENISTHCFQSHNTISHHFFLLFVP